MSYGRVKILTSHFPRGAPLPIDLFTIRDCWNVNEMQIAFTIGCGQVTPTGGRLQYDTSDKLVIKYDIYS